MKRLLLFSILLATSSSAYAQEKPTKVPLVHNGEAGIWLRSDVITKMTADLHDYSLLKIQLKLQLDKIGFLSESLKIRADLLINCDKEADTWKEVASKEAVRADAAVREIGRWYRAPYLWVGVGVALGLTSVYVGHQATK